MFPVRDLNPTRRRAYVNWLLIAANVVVFFTLQPGSFRGDMSPRATDQGTEFLYEHALVPCELSHTAALSDRLARECGGQLVGRVSADPYFPGKNVYLSVLTSMFLHANLLHLLGNMFFLWMFGDNVEDRLGRLTYLLFYLAGGVAAAIGHVLSNANSLAPVVGASGAVAAVMGAYLVQSPKAILTAIVPPLFFLPFRIPAWVFLLEWLALQFYTSADSGVAWVAHVAGFAFGALIAWAGRGRWRLPASGRTAHA